MGDTTSKFLPKHKGDTSFAPAVESADIAQVAPVLGQLLQCLQDRNLPEFEAAMQVLPRFHMQLVPHIKDIFTSQDSIWKYWVLDLVRLLPVETVHQLRADVERIARFPTTSDAYEEVDEKALQLLEYIDTLSLPALRLGELTQSEDGSEIAHQLSYVVSFVVVHCDVENIRCEAAKQPNMYIIRVPKDAPDEDVQQYIHSWLQRLQP